MNRAILIGRLTRDPESTTTQSGISMCRFTLAINRPFKSADGQEQADFIPVIVWRAQADNCGKYLTKGSQCAVVGSIQTRSYDDKNGEKRYVTEVVADNVEFLSRSGQSDGSGSGNFNNNNNRSTKKPITELQPVEDDGADLPF